MIICHYISVYIVRDQKAGLYIMKSSFLYKEQKFAILFYFLITTTFANICSSPSSSPPLHAILSFPYFFSLFICVYRIVLISTFEFLVLFILMSCRAVMPGMSYWSKVMLLSSMRMVIANIIKISKPGCNPLLYGCMNHPYSLFFVCFTIDWSNMDR